MNIIKLRIIKAINESEKHIFISFSLNKKPQKLKILL